MNSSLSQSALSRLLALSNRAFDLERQLGNIQIPAGRENLDSQTILIPSPIADLQDDFDRTVRAGLVTCWLGDSSSSLE